MRRLSRLKYERKSGPIRYIIFRQSLYSGKTLSQGLTVTSVNTPAVT